MDWMRETAHIRTLARKRQSERVHDKGILRDAEERRGCSRKQHKAKT